MKKIFISGLLIFTLSTFCAKKTFVVYQRIPTSPISELPNELRGLWITRFDWSHPNPDSMRARIIAIMKNTADLNYNTIFFQVRGQAETLYPSPFESWSKLLNYTDPGFDPVQFAIEHARNNNLVFYAYINLLPLWNEETPPDHQNHLYHKHGPKVHPDSSWICFEPGGIPMNLNEYYYLNPALPQVKNYLKHVIRHFAENYDVDGIHFDRIRYPGQNYVSDPYSLQKFRTDSLENPVTRSEWARQQLTDLVENVVAEALLIKPYLKISAATWGLYRTGDMAGYEEFGTGYDNYYQDAIHWLDTGIMDFIVPMTYWDIADPKPNFHELWDNFKSHTSNYRNIFPGIRLKREWIAKGEIVGQVEFLRNNGALGHVMFSYRDLEKTVDQKLQPVIYPNRVPLPRSLKRNYAKQIVGLNISQVSDKDLYSRSLKIQPSEHRKTVDSEGWMGLILPHSLPANITIEGILIQTDDWKIPYNYTIEPDSTVSRKMPWLEFRKYPSDTTTLSSFDLLCKTDYPASTFITQDSVKIYKTGIFFRSVPLKMGLNRLKASILTADSLKTSYEIEVYRKPAVMRNPFPLWIDTSSVSPETDQILLKSDYLSIDFIGSLKQAGFLEIKPGGNKISLQREDQGDYSRYLGRIPLSELKQGVKYKLILHLKSESPEFPNAKLKYTVPSTIQVQDLQDFPMVITKQNNNLFRYNLGKIRLGGPLIAEYPKGIILQVDGITENQYRIYLNELESGFIDQDDVDLLPENIVKPEYYVRNVQVTPGDQVDVISIPYPSPVPFAIYPEPENNLIRLSLYGVKTTSTWMVHQSGLQLIRHVTWSQITPDTYQIMIHLKSAKIWGYSCQPEGNRLVFRLKHPPVLQEDSLYKGLTLAIEAGHGGDNYGAVGLSGLLEKDINLDVARKLENIARGAGMEVLQVRASDSYMNLTEKRNAVQNSDAHFLVSIHANATGGGDGYLGVNGVSTYYNNPFWAEFARLVNKNLLELDLKEFGTVGSFNYIVIRLSSRPTILVEQAFMSHAEDEEKLASESFRQQIAQKIFKGLTEYIQYMYSGDQ